MAFELTTTTRAKVLDVRTLSRKNRGPDELPGAQLLLSADLPVETLAMFDGFLPGMLYRKAGGGSQGKLEGLEGVELTAIGEHVKRMPWAYEQTGCRVTIQRATSAISLEDCLVHRVRFEPQKNGGVRVQWTVDAPALSDAERGQLTGMKSTEIEMTLTGPEVDESQQGIPGTEGTDPNKAPKGGWPFPKKAEKATAKDATDTFTEAHAGDDEPAAEHPPERKVGETTVITRRTRSAEPPPSAH